MCVTCGSFYFLRFYIFTDEGKTTILKVWL